jgi:putative PIN family toxin of toxin-antitoxin system
VKVVLDTNVLVAAFAARGLCEAVLEACVVGHELFSSAHILVEVRRVLTKKLKLPPGQREEILSFLRDQVSLVSPAPVTAGACRDPDDLPVLGTAVAAVANCLVTGDQDLLELKRFQSTSIVSPREFHDQLHQSLHGG